ncbi:MAG: CRISPR system precrRNA processing endoribonuclease RAMP protein Cas6 [Marinospirillum sp.]|nr:CRISPR system precrRNA processing endoribonuclease RAMP protein Cas6 [Marinospirillum sp.]
MSLPIQPLIIHFTLTRRWQRPFYTGSLLRGLFGHGLKAVSCMTNAPTCQACPLTTHCSYYRVFEPEGQVFEQQGKRPPPPYVINPPPPGPPQWMQAGERLSFGMNLFGQDALALLPTLISAWKLAAQQPVEGQRVFAFDSLQWLDWNRQPLGTARSPSDLPALQAPLAETTEMMACCASSQPLHLQLITPLRLRVQQRELRAEQLDAEQLLKALLRRVHLLEQAYGQPEPLPEQWQSNLAQLSLQSQLRWVDWKRWSNRQQQALKMGGLLGDIKLTGDWATYVPALALLPWVNLGKNCTLGLGRLMLVKKTNHV